MRRSDLLHMCLQNLFRRKSRTFLTVLGVFIGCCSIVIMISLGIGMKESQEKMLAQMGDLTIITVTPPQGGRGKVKLDDNAVRSFARIPGAEAVTPKLELSDVTFKLYAGPNKRYVASWSSIVGLDTAAMEKMGYRLISGTQPKKTGEILAGQYLAYNFADSMRPEGFNTIDRWSGGFDAQGNPVNVPAPYFDITRTPLTLEVDPGNGGKFSIQLTPTGVTKEDYAKGYETSEGLIMSLRDLEALRDRAQSAAGGARKKTTFGTVLVKTTGIGRVAEVERQIKTMGFNTSSMESIRAPMEKEARQKQMMLSGLGAISLFVAALGITNTMIMSISERTREIGIMKALGCYVRDIRLSFLAEAGAIGLLGGLIGCFVSVTASVVINVISFKLPFSGAVLLKAIVGGEDVSRLSIVPPWLMVFAVLFSVAIGLGSGYYPANKAVRISALEAIKASE